MGAQSSSSGSPSAGSTHDPSPDPERILTTEREGSSKAPPSAEPAETRIRAAHAGTVKALFCAEGDMVSEGSALVELEEV